MTFLGVRFPVCQNCGTRMRIIQRGVRFDEGGYFEQQEFTCAKCNGSLERGVNTDGTVRDHFPTFNNPELRIGQKELD